MKFHRIDEFELEDESGIELTPLIDVIFMLLIFFIVATTFVKPKFEVALPDADAAKIVAEDEKRPVCAGTVFFDGAETPPDAFGRLFAENAEKRFEVFSDEGAPFGVVMALMNAARKQGNEQLVFMVEKNR